jgi:RHS repeat-associated protein
MKTRTTFILSLITILTLAAGSAFGAYSGGTGDPCNPYQIATKADLLALAANTGDYGKCFILTANINMQGRIFAQAIIAAGGSPAFTGTFDGNGHRISGFIINGGSNSYIGLFGQINAGGSVKNLGLEEFAVVSGSSNVGGLAGCNNGGSVINCHSTGDVSGSGNNVGGLIGYYSGNSINNCYSTGKVSGGSNYVGGLVGYYSSGSSISSCYSTGAVSGSAYYVGGLVGYYGGGNISNCYSTGAVSGSGSSPYYWNCGYIGGLVGWNDGSISNCYSTGTVSGSGNNVGGLVGYNTGSIRNCYSSTGTVSGSSGPSNVGGLVGYNNGNGIISNCYSMDTVSGGSNYVGGLVGENDGSISNCYSSTGTVSGSGNVGGLVGYNSGSGSSIENCSSTSQVSGNGQVGGLVGDNRSGSITNCYSSTGSVIGSSGSSNVGGLVGQNESSGSIENCFSTEPVSGSSGSSNVGGLVGNNNSSSIDESYSTGSVSGSSNVGGLVGYDSGSGSISNCYSSTGAVSGSSNVGGLVGYNNGYILDCYSTGHVDGSSNVGGLVGYNNNSVWDSFWDKQTSGKTTSAGGTGKTTAQMKMLSTFTAVDWDFDYSDYVWGIDNGQTYPYLVLLNGIVPPVPSGPTGAPPTSNYFNGNQSQKSGATNDPVNTATGNFLHEETDFAIQTRTSPLEFKRFYNNQDIRTTSLGQGWTHSYYILLAQDATSTNINVRWGDGHTDYWQYDANTATYRAATVGLYDQLIKNTNGTWEIIKKNLDTYNFDSLGRLSTIVDKNANITSLAYNYPSDPNCVTTITDPAGRAITLQYQNGMLTSISDFTSRTVTFSYTNGMLTQVIDVLGHTITYTYDNNGYLKTVTDQRGIVIVNNIYDSQARVIQQRDGRNYLSTFAYDTPMADQTTITDPNSNTTVHTHFGGYLLLQSIQDALGQTITYTYDSSANRISITDRNGHTTAFNYDSRGNVTATLDPNDPNNLNSTGGITTVEYKDANFPDFPTKKTDALENITIWNYDSYGNVKEQIDPNSNHRYWTYNSFGQKLNEKDENGNTTVLTYDTVGRLTQRTDPNGNNTWFGYDSLWRLTDVTDGRGSSLGDVSYTTHTVYDNADRVISITDPNTSESYQHDNVGHKTQITNGRNYKTNYYYDENGNLTKVEKDAPNSQKQTIQYTYDNLNRKSTFSDPNTNITTYKYDAVGHLLTGTNAANNQTQYAYDAQGNMLSVTDGNGVKISYNYDCLNRKVEQDDLLGNHWYWQYDKLGRVIKYTDARGAKTFYGYDVLGRLMSVTDDCNETTLYQYDKVGNLTQIIDAGNIISTQKFYDTANRLKRQEDGNGNVYQYGYDGAGNRISVIDANNQTTTYIYDGHDRLIQINYPDSTQATYSYDRNSNLTSTTGIAGITTYRYDELDRLISSTDCFSKQVQYGYDIVGNRISITYPADSNNPARTVIYSYDKANRLQSITDWASRTWSYTVDGAGRLTQLANPNGVQENRTYDNAGRLFGLAYKKSDDTALISFSYTRDGQGNPTNVNETGALPPNPVLPLKTSYNYDTDNRLTGTNQPATYNYDNNGNLITRTVSGTTTNFSYDVENRLISQSTGGSNVQHIYDSRGNRIARVQNSVTTRYVLDYSRDMSHVLCETDGTGKITAYYIHGPQIVGRIGTDGSIRYYHSDHIGNIIALTDSNQTITDKYAYTPFGVTDGQQGSTINPFTFAGGVGVMSEADGLYFMRARFYESGIGRFLSKDPVEGRLTEPPSLHKYNYAHNNPLFNTDPSGLTAYSPPDKIDFITWLNIKALNTIEETILPAVGNFLKYTGPMVMKFDDLTYGNAAKLLNGIDETETKIVHRVFNGKADETYKWIKLIVAIPEALGGDLSALPEVLKYSVPETYTVKGATYTNVPYSYENDVQAKTWATKSVPGQQK